MRTFSKILRIAFFPFLICTCFALADDKAGKRVNIGPTEVDTQLYVDLTKQPVNVEIICHHMKQRVGSHFWESYVPEGVVVVLINRDTEEKFILQPNKAGKIEVQVPRGFYFAKITKYDGWITDKNTYFIRSLNETTKTVEIVKSNQVIDLRLVE